jgi:type IV secretion system protein VirB9
MRPLDPTLAALAFALAAAAPLSAQDRARPALPALTSGADGARTASYGAGVPVLECDSLAVCRVELEAGERFRMAPALGDSERWLTVQDDGGPVPVVLVKPKTCGIATNLMLLTDRRSYDLDLKAGPCRGGDRRERTRVVRFAYPASPVQAAASVARINVPTLAERAAAAPNTAYRWRSRGAFPWAPARVADDGAHVYVALPSAARPGPAPVLYALEGGKRTLLNYAVEGDLYVTDRLFDRAALVVGDASLEIEHRAPSRRRALGRPALAVLSAVGGLLAGEGIRRVR